MTGLHEVLSQIGLPGYWTLQNSACDTESQAIPQSISKGTLHTKQWKELIGTIRLNLDIYK